MRRLGDCGLTGRSGGSLLIELSVTLTLLVVGILGLSIAILTGQRCQTWSRDRLLAGRMLANQLEYIGRSSFDDILPTYNGKVLGAQSVDSTTNLRAPVIASKVAQLDTHLLGVTLTATWNDETGAKTLSLYQEFGK